MVERVQGLPQAVGVAEAARNWRTEIAPAERAAVNMAASRIFLNIYVLLSESKTDPGAVSVLRKERAREFQSYR